MNQRNRLLRILEIVVLSLTGLLFFNGSITAQQTDNQRQSRDIVPTFPESRPPAADQPGSSKPPVKSTRRKSKLPAYHRISQRTNSGKITTGDRPGKRLPKTGAANIPENQGRQIGVTLWRLNEVGADAGDETLPDAANGKKRYLMPERVSIDTIFAPYDLVRLSLESSRRGFLYIVDQEMLADGTLGDAYLVFPNKRIRSGGNLTAPGKLVELPDLKGNPFYFELRPENPNGEPLAAEILTVIITDQPILNLAVGESPRLIDEKTLSDWRTKWAGRAEIFETGETDSENYTKTEREAASGSGTLSGDDPLPQTIFLVEGNRSAGSLITVPLWYGGN